MIWSELTEASQIEELVKQSYQHPILIFKHSTSCSISRTTLDRLERNWNEADMSEMKPYFLDLLEFRNISNNVADLFAVQHESPQVLLIKNGKSIYDRSHFEIEYKGLKVELLKIEKEG
jgi:bacillithiol system protein YtxJ